MTFIDVGNTNTDYYSNNGILCKSVYDPENDEYTSVLVRYPLNYNTNNLYPYYNYPFEGYQIDLWDFDVIGNDAFTGIDPDEFTLAAVFGKKTTVIEENAFDPNSVILRAYSGTPVHEYADSRPERFDPIDFEYTVLHNDTVYVIYYLGDPDEEEPVSAAVPKQIMGYPVTEIGFNGSFAPENNLKELTIPATVTSIGYGAFSNLSNLTAIIVDEENEFYSSADGVLFNIDKYELIKYPEGKVSENYEVPKIVEYIGEGAFTGSGNTDHITIRNNNIGAVKN